jgi:diguanylate cyclase (GGDEF)-like protein/PAS domain S-box-containing protein
MRWLDAVHPDDRDPALLRWQEALQLGTPLASEYRLSVAGEYRWVRVRGVPRHGPNGDIQEWVGTITDVTAQRTAEDARRSTQERYRLAARATRDAIWDWDLATDELAWGEATGSVFGFGADDLAGSGPVVDRTNPPRRSEVVLDRVKKALEGSSEFSQGEYRFRRGDGTYANVLDRGYIIRDEDGRAIRMVGAMQDLSERARAQSTLRGSEERLRLALRAGRMVAWNLHVPTQYVTRGDTGLAVLGMTSGPFSEFLERIPEEDRPRLQSYLAGLGSDPFATAEFRFRSPSGKLLWLGTRAERSGEDEIVGVTFDITDRKRIEEEVWRVANHDPLTGLPNRALLKLRLERALTDAKRDGTSVSLLMVDLDDFKDINDSLGHDAGDALLREVARRLSGMVRESDIVARLGGDEFAIVLGDPLRLEHAVRFADAVLQVIKQPFDYHRAKLSTSASIGLAAYPDHDDVMQELTIDADIALYQAKRAGRDRVVTFSSALRKDAEHRFHLLGEFREALDANRIVPFYQPKVCLRTGKIIGFEALARWLHPARGVLTPGSFQAAFDHPELSGRIGASLLRQVARDVRSWLDSGLNPGRVAVNFSSAEFGHADLAERVLGTLEDAGTPTSSFEVEVTETVFLGRNSEQTAATLNRLHAAGVQIALDDFGTGFASLAHLKQFPVDHIKIDQSFIRNLEQDSDDAAIVRAVIGLGQSLGLQVTAEGVETLNQADRLRANGCDYAQGYLYAKPMPAAGATLLLQAETGSLRPKVNADSRQTGVERICSDAA